MSVPSRKAAQPQVVAQILPLHLSGLSQVTERQQERQQQRQRGQHCDSIRYPTEQGSQGPWQPAMGWQRACRVLSATSAWPDPTPHQTASATRHWVSEASLQLLLPQGVRACCSEEEVHTGQG